MFVSGVFVAIGGYRIIFALADEPEVYNVSGIPESYSCHQYKDHSFHSIKMRDGRSYKVGIRNDYLSCNNHHAHRKIVNREVVLKVKENGDIVYLGNSEGEIISPEHLSSSEVKDGFHVVVFNIMMFIFFYFMRRRRVD
ncbi:MAG: hypothetical protein ACK4E7_04390 [Permianibacter sp.]